MIQLTSFKDRGKRCKDSLKPCVARADGLFGLTQQVLLDGEKMSPHRGRRLFGVAGI